MKKWVGGLALVLVAVVGLGLGYLIGGAGDTIRYTVIRGDTLGEIAAAHGVTVAELRDWNGIEGDLIEVGDILLVHSSVAGPAPTKTKPKRRSAKPAPADGGTALAMPAAKACLAGPSGDGLADDAAVASAGLSHGQVKASMDAFLPITLRCVPQGTSGRMQTKIRVGCNGLVDLVEVESSGLPDEVTACVQETLAFAEFPAHDLPDGELFQYPLTFSWE